MVRTLLLWWPWLLVAALPGLLNTGVAVDELFKECRRLPFFQPHLSWGFWLWVGLQFSIPTLLFALLFDVAARPAIGWDLVGQALTFGLGFVAILNSRTDIADLPTLDIKRLYNLLVAYARDQIAAGQTGKTTAFWSEVSTELLATEQAFQAGFEYLALYTELDLSLGDEERQQAQRRIAQAMALEDRAAQVNAILSLLDVRRRDLPVALARFGISAALISRYFPWYAEPPLIAGAI